MPFTAPAVSRRRYFEVRPENPLADPGFLNRFSRAWRTAGVLAELEGWPERPKPSTPLEPTSRPEKAARVLEDYEGAGAVAVVGHRPGLHELASYLLTGDAEGLDVKIKKGGAVCIRFEGFPEPGAGKLRWLLMPEFLRQQAQGFGLR